jgi:hypothetical protein
LLGLSGLVAVTGLSTFLGVVAITGWWAARWLGLLPADNRLSLALEGFLWHFRGTRANSRLHKWYTWEFPTRPGLSRRLPGSRFFTELWVNRQRYIHYQQRPRQLSPNHFDIYVTLSTPEIETLAGQLAQLGQLVEYPKYPLETLVEKKGDCEDQSILAAALLAAMGYEVALLILPIHVALGVAGFDSRPGSRVVHPADGALPVH